jgi:translocation and assembly module TamB
MRRALWILLTPLLGFLVVFSIFNQVLEPKISHWAVREIQNYSASSLPVIISAEKMEIRFLKPSISLKNVTFEGQQNLKTSMQKVKIPELTLFVDFLHLLSGRITLSALVIDRPQVEMNIDPFLEDESPSKLLPMQEIFSKLEGFPLKRILLNEIDFKIFSEKKMMAASISGGDILINNFGKSVALKTLFPKIKLQMSSQIALEGQLETKILLTENSLKIIQINLLHHDSEISAFGEISDIKSILVKPTGALDIQANLNLSDLSSQVQKVKTLLYLPKAVGLVKLDVKTMFNGLNSISGQGQIRTQDLKISKFEIGDAKIQGEFKDRSIYFSEVKVFHPAGEALLTESQLSLGGNYTFRSRVNVSKLDLHKLFQNIDLSNIPVGMDLQGVLPCEGQARPHFTLSCNQASISAKYIWVKAGSTEKSSSILNIPRMNAQGSLQITNKAVAYKASLNLGTSSGFSDGVIDFSEGFKINFKTKHLDFLNIENLAKLKLEGSSSIEGFTQGDSHAAIFEMRVNARDFYFENFFLGNLITDLKYKRGQLHFENVAGAINKTNYLAELVVDLEKERIRGDFRSPTSSLSDVAKVFEKIYELPVQVQGFGAAKGRFDGPLDLWKMNYELDSAFKKISIGPENFDSLAFNVEATEGNLKTNKALLIKANSSLNIRGEISSNQIMEIYADGKNWKLEESDFFISGKTNASIIGNLNFAAELKNSLRNPNIQIKGLISDTLFEEQEIPNSNFIFRLDRNSLEAQISLFGDKVQADVQIPTEKNHLPLAIKIKTNNWNYSSLLSLVGGASLANEYKSNLTSLIDLKSESGDIFKATGKISIDKVFLKRGNLSLTNSEPIEIISNNGITNFRNFTLEGAGNSLFVRGEGFTADNLNLSINFKTDLRLLQIFTPFLEDLAGQVSLSTTVTGSIKKPLILGTMQNNNAFLKIKGFPHPIERLTTDVVFSQSKILINSVKGQLAGGQLTGGGNISINGIRDLPLSLRVRLENVAFNVPEKVQTNGNADILLSGKWFPYVLSGTYHISSAYLDKEFTEEAEANGIKQSLYLPKFIREGHFEPISLDLQLILEKNIVIKNSLLDGNVNGQLQIKGYPSDPILIGKINIDKKTKLIFKDKIFIVQNGLIDFNDPTQINPNLYISASSRIDNYDISLLTQGSAKNLAIRLTSIPPLAEQEIISLIALGVTSSRMDQNLQSKQQAEQLGVEIGGAVLAKPIAKRLESTLGLNLQVTSEYNATRNISVPKITLSRQLSEKIKVSGSRPVKDTQSYDLKLEYLINNNVTAVGSFENRGFEENSTLQTTQPETQSIFGLDLEFKREFR